MNPGHGKGRETEREREREEVAWRERGRGRGQLWREFRWKATRVSTRECMFGGTLDSVDRRQKTMDIAGVNVVSVEVHGLAVTEVAGQRRRMGVARKECAGKREVVAGAIVCGVHDGMVVGVRMAWAWELWLG